MSERVTCEEHGENLATIVCVHIIDTLRDRKPRGFLWSVEDEDDYSAVCQACRNMPDDEWSRLAVELGRVVCFGCFKKAAILNGVKVSEPGETMQ